MSVFNNLAATTPITESIPWKEMQIGHIYRNRRTGKYFIYAGRATVDCHAHRISTDAAYTYIYIDYPNVLVSRQGTDTLDIVASTARIRTSEYRDIANEHIGAIPKFTHQHRWNIADYTIDIDPYFIPGNSKKINVEFSPEQQQAFVKYANRKARKRATV